MTRELPSVSVLTIARGRADHLGNVILGLSRQTCPPCELIVAAMDEAPYALPDAPFPIRQILVPGDPLPLARARNVAAAGAGGDVLAFLDVDCIPGPAYVEDYARAVAARGGLMMGEVLYLPGGATDPGWTIEGFDAVAVRHSDRQGPPAEGFRACNDYRCFWSLNFCMSRDDWARSGGFDDRFAGYGGEDTDFGRTLSEMGMPIWWMSGARVYHQFHDHCMPPIHHVASVVRNAQVFAEKWGHRTMEHWLHAFRMMGLIGIGPEGIRILREPDAMDFALCRQTGDMPYAATSRVVRILEDRARARDGLPPDMRPERMRHLRMVDEQERIALTGTGG